MTTLSLHYSLVLLYDVDTEMLKVVNGFQQQREKTPASGKRPVNLKLSASQRLPSAGGNQSVNMQRESVNRHCADTATKQEVAMSRAKRVLDMGDGNSGTRKKRTAKRSSASADTSLQPDFTPVKSKQVWLCENVLKAVNNGLCVPNGCTREYLLFQITSQHSR